MLYTAVFVPVPPPSLLLKFVSISRLLVPFQVKLVLSVNVLKPVAGVTLAALRTTVNPVVTNDVLANAVNAVCCIFIWKFNSVRASTAAMLNAMADICEPAVRPSVDNSAAVTIVCCLEPP